MNTHIDPDIREYIALMDAGKDDEAFALFEEMQAKREASARKQMAEHDRQHAAFHGHPLRYVTVERRRGYRGRMVCSDCYYGKEWK